MKRIRFRLSGWYEMNQEAWYENQGKYLSTGEVVRVPRELTISIDPIKRVINFSFIDHSSLIKSPEECRLDLKGRLTDCDWAYEEHKDDSGGLWKCAKFFGEYRYYDNRSGGDLESLVVTQPQYDDYSVFVSGLWLHKDPHYNYSGLRKELRRDSCIMVLDEGQQSMLNNLFDYVK